MSDDLEKTALQEIAQRLRSDSLDSLQLLSSLTENPICSVEVDASVPCVAVIWKRYATSLQLRFVHENILTLLETHDLHAVLGDDTALPIILAEDRRWIADDWMPRAIASGLLAAASVKPSASWGQAAVSSVQGILAQHMETGSFDDRETARRWLQAVLANARR
jgi:hypothetical protein